MTEEGLRTCAVRNIIPALARMTAQTQLPSFPRRRESSGFRTKLSSQARSPITDASSAGFMGFDPELPESGSRRETAPAPDVVHRYPYWAIRESHFASHTPRSRMYLASPGCTGTRSTAASTPRRCMWAMSA